MRDSWEQILQDKIAATWPGDVQQTYRTFYDRVRASSPLTIKIGKGGLSFYKQLKSDSVFVCHFNAEPRKGQKLGFADFRFDALKGYLDIKDVVHVFRESAPPAVAIKVNKLWCSLHFPIELSETVADLFSEHIIRRIQ